MGDWVNQARIYPKNFNITPSLVLMLKRQLKNGRLHKRLRNEGLLYENSKKKQMSFSMKSIERKV